MDINMTTGNSIVDAVGQLNITGNVIPEAWYTSITNKCGKPSSLAILLLADIVYWYRPVENRDEISQKVTYSKKFSDSEYLQRSYDQITDKFGISKKQAREALILLEELGVVKRHFKEKMSGGIKLSNVMYLELIPDVLKAISFPDEDHVYKKGNTPFPKGNDPLTNSETPPSEKVTTYTKTTTETTAKISSTTLESDPLPKEAPSAPVVDAKAIFNGLGLSDKDISSILKAVGNDLAKCINAKAVLDKQRYPITNVVGWLIKAVKENYQSAAKTPSPPKNEAFMNFEQRGYTDEELDAIERAMLMA